jgi:hypothetical protein
MTYVRKQKRRHASCYHYPAVTGKLVSLEGRLAFDRLLMPADQDHRLTDFDMQYLANLTNLAGGVRRNETGSEVCVGWLWNKTLTSDSSFQQTPRQQA